MRASDARDWVIFGSLCVLGFMIFVPLVFVWFFNMLAWQSRYEPNIEKALGINVITPYVDGREVLQFNVAETGYAYSQGLRSKDILDKSNDFNFGRLIVESQGSSLTFNVVRDDEVVQITFNNIPKIGTECIQDRRSAYTSSSETAVLVRTFGGCW